MRRKIHTQGDLDGACFLYAVANAHTALTGEMPDLRRWDEGLSTLKWPVDFQKACVGTTDHYERDPEELCRAANTVLDALTGDRGHLAATPFPEVADLPGVAQLLTSESVAVLWYRGDTQFVQNGDHWVCAQSADHRPIRVHVACSIRRSDDGRFNDNEYQEVHHEEWSRYSNDRIDGDMACRIMQGFVLQIRRRRESG